MERVSLCGVRACADGGYRFPSTPDSKLLKKVMHVILDRGHFNVEPSRDLFVRQASLDQRQNLAFTVRDREILPAWRL